MEVDHSLSGTVPSKTPFPDDCDLDNFNIWRYREYNFGPREMNDYDNCLYVVVKFYWESDLNYNGHIDRCEDAKRLISR